MKKIFFITLIITTFVAGCRKIDDLISSSIFGVKQGHTVSISAIKIKLDGVQDSRCAEGAVCIWEGEAVANMTFTKNGIAISKSLKVKGMARNPKPDTIMVFNKKAILLNVFPYPHIDEVIPQKDYVVFMKLE